MAPQQLEEARVEALLVLLALAVVHLGLVLVARVLHRLLLVRIDSNELIVASLLHLFLAVQANRRARVRLARARARIEQVASAVLLILAPVHLLAHDIVHQRRVLNAIFARLTLATGQCVANFTIIIVSMAVGADGRRIERARSAETRH